MTGLNFILLIVGFFYLISRLNKIENRLGGGEKDFFTETYNKTPADAGALPKPPLQEEPLWHVDEELKPAHIEELPELSIQKHVADAKVKYADKELEFKLGSKLFTGIGAVAILFGVAFFLRYAFENDLITETMRVVLGLLSGIVLLAVGEFARQRYPHYSQIVTGGGLGVLYLSLFSAFNWYTLVSLPVAFSGMIFVTAIGVFLSVRYNSLPLASFAALGGFLTPILLSSGENHPHALFLYIALLDIGILALAVWKLWRGLTFGSFIGTVILSASWFAQFYTEPQLAIAQSYITVFFLIFFGISFLQYYIQKSPQDEADLILTTINPAIYFAASYAIINPVHHASMGFITAVLAAFYLLMAFVVGRQGETTSLFSRFLAGIGFVFLVLAVPIQFHKIWITIAWAAEGLVLTFLGFQMRSRALRLFAQAVFLLVFFRLLVFDSALGTDAVPWLNDRIVSFGISFALIGLASVIYWVKRDEVSGRESALLSLLLIEEGIIFISGGTIEIMEFFKHWWLSILWSVSAVLIAGIALALKSAAARLFAFGVLMMAVLRLIAFDTVLIEGSEAFVNIRFAVFLTAITASVGTWLLYNALKERTIAGEYEVASSIVFLESYFLLVWLGSAEIHDFHNAYWYPIFWSFTAFFGGWISLIAQNAVLRAAAYLTFAMAAYRLIAFGQIDDYSTFTPLFNTRVLEFLVSIIALSVFVYLISKWRGNIHDTEARIVRFAAFLGAHFLLLLLLSRETLDFFSQRFYKLSSIEKLGQNIRYANMKNASLSVLWTFYAIALLIIGIITKSIAARVLALLLFGIVIFKVFLYDTSSLSNLYRFISFITLGIILLLAGFLYNRFKDRITQFIQAD